jgi:hypothetical protein
LVISLSEQEWSEAQATHWYSSHLEGTHTSLLCTCGFFYLHLENCRKSFRNWEILTKGSRGSSFHKSAMYIKKIFGNILQLLIITSFSSIIHRCCLVFQHLDHENFMYSTLCHLELNYFYFLFN